MSNKNVDKLQISNNCLKIISILYIFSIKGNIFDDLTITIDQWGNET